jgi:hypothetical protein
MPKWSRLGEAKSPVRLSNGKKQNGSQKQDGRPYESRTQIWLQMVGPSLDLFINKGHKKIFYSCQNNLG